MAAGWQQTAFGFRPVRWAVAILFIALGGFYRLVGRPYRALHSFCWVVRVSNTGAPRALARRLVFRTIARIRAAPDNPVIQMFRRDPASAAVAALYQESGVGPRDLFRDVMVLKKATDGEKGVILLKYARTFAALVALGDVKRLMARYTFVLEPCWAGYCDPILLMWLTPDQPVLVQCFTDEDYQFVRDVGAPFVALRMGPADWVNADTFEPRAGVEKRYDLVMVANFAKHKRHATLFRALRDVRDRDVRVLLVGFAWRGRTADHIRAEAAAMNNPRISVEIVESVPQSRLAELVSETKVFVFLSRKEGDNKALVEAMFANVPVIVYDESIGGARGRVNSATGVLASDAGLGARIRYMLEHYRDFSPREWALAHTGSATATRILDEELRRAVTAAGGRYSGGIVEKTNAPNLAYKHPEDRDTFAADYDFVRSCLFSKRA
jgi:glycosyltransferase involved in cell wall biosynthesis